MKRREISVQASAISFQPLDVSSQWSNVVVDGAELGLVETGRAGPQAGRRKYGHDGRGLPVNGDFRCAACGSPVSAAAWLSGVQNRNHCPRCLWSKHLDLHVAGDRLAACKEKMRPIGLALKQTHKKYAPLEGEADIAGKPSTFGELMLAHECQGCGKLSVNRIAADDDAEALMRVFQTSLALDAADVQALAAGGVRLLHQTDAALVRRRLFGGA
jgi:hypothetical protein